MIAFTFPGQGSQKPAMGEAWSDHPSWELVSEASEATGRDVNELLLHADGDELKLTNNSQLATYVMSMVTLDAVERLGIEPSHLAGHSLGEYSALTASGSISFEDGLRIVAERGEAMRVASELRTGTMAAVLGLDDDQVDIACQRVDGDVWVANFNAPGQVVVAGDPEAIEAAGVIAKELGAKRVMPVAVSGAFHTPFMAPARDRLRKAIAEADIRDADLPVHANVDATAHTDASQWSSLMAAQLCSPVRWRQILLSMAESGVKTFVELGPGTILKGMAKRTVPGATTISVNSPADLDALLETVSNAPSTDVAPLEGEHLFATERLVVSPSAGIFEPLIDLTDDNNVKISVGDVIGTVGVNDVRSQFAGSLMGVLAMSGERVGASQPIAWLRVD